MKKTVYKSLRLQKSSLLFMLLFATKTLMSQEMIQEVTGPKRAHEIGVNVTELLSNFLSFTNTAVSPDPYFLVYKKLNTKRTGALRAGIGLRMRNESNDRSGLNNKLKLNNVYLRIGYEWRYSITSGSLFGPRMDLYYDHSDSYQEIETRFDKSVLKSNSNSVGLGLVLGTQFEISKRVSIGTEAALTLKTGWGKFSENFQAFPNQNTESKSKSTHSSQIPPTSLYLMVRF